MYEFDNLSLYIYIYYFFFLGGGVIFWQHAIMAGEDYPPKSPGWPDRTTKKLRLDLWLQNREVQCFFIDIFFFVMKI